ncbi:Delta-1-pyrroline-5-carboxylate dehydrogenase 12A1, mitochondrial [Ananas comosus]|uniref:Delta-1-pyrroline-5-carboxylate dehydrogenase 12A1, mitochondrial n=1 Tax=Ananas comosus TaxID=4615 RepID=A0A199VLZ6_ANACO|nr:Delta-1-pyrroline-5-carboxylate dehydrogenase 12A1, mitochondrial [Ananas comosus]
MNRFISYRELGAGARRAAWSWFSPSISLASRRSVHSPSFATVDVEDLSSSHPAEVKNLVQGNWKTSANWSSILDPLNGDRFIKPLVKSLSKCPKYGLHNPLRAQDRYVMYGDISAKAANMLAQPEVRFLARSFAVPGNHLGQHSHGYRWPYGPVAIITPFNFPLEIPLLQVMGALYMGNKPVLKVDSKYGDYEMFILVSIVMEQMLRLLHDCGLPMEDVDFINSDGITMNKLLIEAKPQMTLFTGSSHVAEKLASDLNGRIKLEDAGFDWKILGPDVQEVDYVAWVCDQDAYACSGQKCSAQSILFVHENWASTGLIDKLQCLAGKRKLEDLTIGPVLTVTTASMLEHIHKLLKIPGSKILFGGEPLENHSIPEVYGALKPTALFVPLGEMLKTDNFELVTREIFGPFQIITEYRHDQLELVLDACERMHAHLTAAVVSNDPLFLQARFTLINVTVSHISNIYGLPSSFQDVIGRSVNGTTYAGIRARTTGAPQNHWFGPAGDPRGAGIGTPEAIKLVWSCHREVIYDIGPLPKDWEVPAAT